MEPLKCGYLSMTLISFLRGFRKPYGIRDYYYYFSLSSYVCCYYYYYYDDDDDDDDDYYYCRRTALLETLSLNKISVEKPSEH